MCWLLLLGIIKRYSFERSLFLPYLFLYTRNYPRYCYDERVVLHPSCSIYGVVDMFSTGNNCYFISIRSLFESCFLYRVTMRRWIPQGTILVSALIPHFWLVVIVTCSCVFSPIDQFIWTLIIPSNVFLWYTFQFRSCL